MKTELLTPYHYNSGNRGWTPVFLEINSTEVNFYRLSAEKKVIKLVETLFIEANSLHDLATNIKNDRIKREKNSFDSACDVDLFGDDPYGNAGGLEAYKQSATDKMRLLWQKSRQEASAKLLPKFYDILSDNRFLFEPTTNTATISSFKSNYVGSLMHTYTLADCDVGEAPSLNQLISAMYKETATDSLPQSASALVRYKNVLRLRVELKQILLQFWSFYGMVHWYRNILIGCDLASPLETRMNTRFKSIPSRQTRLNNALLIATAAAANYRHGEPDDEGFPSDEICFNDPFLAGTTLKPLGAHPCSCSDSGSVCSNPESLFSSGRPSVASADTSGSDKCHYTKAVHSHRLVCYDKYYTTLEKQYISNCIPDLNSYDKWQLVGLTLSNFQQYMNKLQLKQYEKDPKNVYISARELVHGVNHYDKTESSSGPCRRFIVHQSGLVSVAI